MYKTLVITMLKSYNFSHNLIIMFHQLQLICGKMNQVNID